MDKGMGVDMDAFKNYIVVVDVGSKGTRAHVYAWSSIREKLLETSGGGGDVKVKLSFPTLEYVKNASKKVKPGIHEYVAENGVDEDDIRRYLDHLLGKTLQNVPREQHYRTPIFFHSTAGIRTLNLEAQNDLMEEICSYLKEYTDFFIPDCKSHINVLPGEIEGLYSWITLNYLLRGNDDDSVESGDKSSFGMLQLGGGSTQICYEDNKDYTLDLVLDDTYNLYSTSFLGFGLKQLHEQYLETLVISNTDVDPCLPRGEELRTTISGEKYLIKGSGDFNQCRDKIYNQIIKNIENCSEYLSNADPNTFQISSCILDSKLDLDQFIAISGFSDTIKKLADWSDISLDETNNGMVYNSQRLLQSTIDLCNSPIQNVENDEINLCFNSVYVFSLLHSGFGLGLDESITINDEFKNFKFTWTYGRALLYAYDDAKREYDEFYDIIDDTKQIGYKYKLSPTKFIKGSEQSGIEPRPSFEMQSSYPTFTSPPTSPSTGSSNEEFDDLEENVSVPSHSKYGLIFTIILVIMFCLLPLTRNFIAQLLRKLKIKLLGFKSLNASRKSTMNNQQDLEMFSLDNDLENNEIDEFNVSDQEDWDNDSDGIERAL
ncbi:uncharacterized protein C5L36_0E04210 [Pichia kudriavzevii]|uniref:Golgi apyrase n=1 Tax=Pichia kudriavzevii TaxID=4909 RepID=A0A099NTY4_PICKU|nr:uncharacterized protein C5L36_0E04210 [Pichia kudriavzevii]AWU78366.1 hypothetical protein C5L36_0E04210 [Pichia kudriavzevii]KGK36308.1 hypothetical protein JL09_g4547 [Pichia kudriavzevii]ONH72312.1 Golgi apyrase [Pichia kudriavzevii]